MSWLEDLCKTYDNNANHIGDRSDRAPLLPVCQWIQNAQIEIAIDLAGNFIKANVVPAADAATIIPATEDSAGRTGSRPVSHPLCDKLRYIAGDFVVFGGKVTKGYEKEPRGPHEGYIEQLSAWCASAHRHRKVAAVLAYVKKGRVVADLVGAGVLRTGSDGKLLNSGPGAGDPFVRWLVQTPGDPQDKLWKDPTVWKSWADYYASRESTKGLCYVTGEEAVLAKQHPKRIRNAGDGAKLISSNDTTGFTFLGRFTTAEQACGVGFETTQKAHSALRWLIRRQGWRDGGLAIVAWAVSGIKIPDPLADTKSLLSGNADDDSASPVGYTAQEVGTQLSKLIAGYSVKLPPTEHVVVIALDSATPGRMAIRFYRELTGSQFLERVKAWHDIENGCTWQQRLGKGRVFVGAASPRDIAEAAYGRRLDDNLRKANVERLLPCIVDGVPLPRDLVESCVRRPCNRFGVERWEWEKALGIACALYKYHNTERRYKMVLEPDRKTRDYLYGRLLALAEDLEGRALYLAKEDRESNAARLMQRFADRPHSTWRTIELSLGPYRSRLRAKGAGLLLPIEKEMDEVFDAFAPDEFRSDKPLSGEFLLGFHCQRSSLWAKRGSQGDIPEDSTDVEEG